MYDLSSVSAREQAAVAAFIAVLKDQDHKRRFDIAVEEERLRKVLRAMGRDDSYITEAVRYAYSQQER